MMEERIAVSLERAILSGMDDIGELATMRRQLERFQRRMAHRNGLLTVARDAIAPSRGGRRRSEPVLKGEAASSGWRPDAA